MSHNDNYVNFYFLCLTLIYKSSMEHTTKMRLNKAIAHAGICSRRKADELIASGQVAVNGQIVNNPATTVQGTDKIAINGKEIFAEAGLCYLVLNKPVMTVSTSSDPQKRPTVMAYVPNAVRNLRLYPVGRLDYLSEGLLLLTNDGDLAQAMTHPRHHVPKKYEVLIRGGLDESALEIMRKGMTLSEGIRLMPVTVISRQLKNGNTLLTMTLRQGINRQIRKMCSDLHLVILKLRRISQGCLKLEDLPPGQTRFLGLKEANFLRRELGLSPLAHNQIIIS